MFINYSNKLIKQAISGILCCIISITLTSCGNGDTAENMPIGGGDFRGTFSPGVYNLADEGNGDSCKGGNGLHSSETVKFTVASVGETDFYDDTDGLEVDGSIFSGTFTNPINQNNPCFTGQITQSECPAINGGGYIEFYACHLAERTNATEFTADYRIYGKNDTNKKTVLLYGTIDVLQ